MGLDIIANFECENSDELLCDCGECDVSLFRGPYSSFSTFRDGLAQLFPEGAPQTLQTHFLDHSDCEGWWTAEDCQEIHGFFEKDVLPRLDSDWPDYYRVTRLMTGLKFCVEKKCGASFC